MTTASAANFRRTVNRARRYYDPLPACPLNPHPDEGRNLLNVTGVAGVLNAEFRATRHGENGPLDAHRAAAWAVENLDALASHETGAAHAAIVRAAKADLAAAADRGTAVHELVEGELLGRPPLMLDEAAEPYRATVLSLLEWLEAEVVLVEAAVFAWRSGYAGTLDAVLRSARLGGTFLVDWKSRGADSGHGAYEKELAQLGLLADAEYVMVEQGGEAHRAPMPSLDGVAVVSLRPDSWAIYPAEVDGAVAAGRAALAAYEARDLSKRAGKKALGKPLTADGGPVALTPAKAAVAAAQAESNLAERAAAAAALAYGMLPDDELGRRRFLERWSLALPGVPTPKRASEWTLAQVEAVERFVEAPFADPPPATEEQLAAADGVEFVEAPEGRLLRLPEDCGGTADPVAVKMLRERLNRAPKGVRAWQNVWRAEGDEAGLAWRMGRGQNISERAFSVSLAGWWLARILEQAGAEAGGEEDVRRVLATVVGDEAEFLSAPVGAVLGALTLDEASLVVSVAEAVFEGAVRITDDDRFEVAS
jgi:hypothetical protein